MVLIFPWCYEAGVVGHSLCWYLAHIPKRSLQSLNPSEGEPALGNLQRGRAGVGEETGAVDHASRRRRAERSQDHAALPQRRRCTKARATRRRAEGGAHIPKRSLQSLNPAGVEALGVSY